MTTHHKINQYQLAEVDKYKKHAFPLFVEKSQIRMAPGGILLHKDTINEDLDIGMFVGEAFRKHVLITLLSEKKVPSGGDYSETRWNHSGHEFYGHGAVPHPTHLEFTISLLGPQVRWTEEWIWQIWPEPSDIQHRLDVLIKNYEVTQRLSAYLQGEKLDHSFDESSKQYQIEGVSVQAREGQLCATCSCQSSTQFRNAAQVLEHLAKFLEFKPKSLAASTKAEPMEITIELA